MEMTDPGRVRVTMKPRGESRTEKAHQQECDINYLIERVRGGKTVPIIERQAMYGDFSNVGQFQDAIEAIEVASDMFEDLPATVRKHFLNDPVELLKAVDDPARQDELRQLDLLEPLPPEPQGNPERPDQADPPKEPEGGENTPSN